MKKLHISEIFSKEMHEKIKNNKTTEIQTEMPFDLIKKINELLFSNEKERFKIFLNVPNDYKFWKDNIIAEEDTENKTFVNIFKNTKETKRTVKFNNFGIEIFNSNILIYGKYVKISRDMYQTRFKKHKNVETHLNYLKEFFEAEDIIFSSLGREDFDVRNFTGRDFVLKLVNPVKNFDKKFVNKYDLSKLSENKVAFYNLRRVDSRILEMFKCTPMKEYECLVICKTKNKTNLNIDLTNKFIEIQQRTPLRVLHRRANLERDKQILITYFNVCKVKGEVDFEVIDDCCENFVKENKKNEENNLIAKFPEYKKPDKYFFEQQDGTQEKLIELIQNRSIKCKCSLKNKKSEFHLIKMRVISSSGAYIKEFVNGDFQRTKNSLIDLCEELEECEMAKLDVVRLIY